MKVLHITTDFPYIKDGKLLTYGGLGACVHQMIKGLKGEGVDIDILTRKDYDKKGLAEPFENIYRTNYIQIGNSRNWKLTHALALVPTLTKLIEKNKYDFIHTHNPPAAVVSNYVGAKYGLKTMMTMHGPWARVRETMQGLARAIEIDSLNNSDYVCFDSNSLMKEYQSNIKYTTIANAVDTDKFYPKDKWACKDKFKLDYGEKIFLYAGRNVFGKDITSIKELAKRFPKYMFLVAGTKAEMYDYEHPNIKYLGTIPNDDMPSLYSAVDALILDTKAESLSRAAMESMSCGTAVLLSNIPANKELLGNTDSGLIFDNIDNLSDMIKEFDSVDFSSMGESGRRHIIENYTIRDRIDKYLSMYNLILNK